MERGIAVRPAGAPMVPMADLRPGSGGNPSGATEELKSAGSELAVEAQQAGARIAGSARSRAHDEMDRRSTEAGDRVAVTAQDMRDVAGELRRKGRDAPADLVDHTADRAERFARYLKEADGETILADAREFGRRRPALVVAGAAALGIIAGRVVRASAPGVREEVTR